MQSGVKTAKTSGADTATANHFQLAKKSAIHGKRHAAKVKKIAIDMFATNVRHLGPTYSKTGKGGEGEGKLIDLSDINLTGAFE